MTQAGDVDWEPGDERRELGEALRRLLDVVVQTGAPPEDLRTAAAMIDEMTAKLATSAVRAGMSVAPDSYRAHMSLVGGMSHPVARNCG